MSARQLKKLREREELRLRAEKEAAASAGPGDDGGDGSDHDEEDVVDRLRPKNVFAAFSALEQEDDDDDEEDDKADNAEHAPAADDDAAAKPIKPKPSKKKKKKKAKAGKTKQDEKSIAAVAAEDTTALSGDGRTGAGEPKRRAEIDGLDEIDRALAELNMKPAGPALAANAHPSQRGASSDLLKVNFHNLRVLNELREVFGRDTIQAAAEGGDGGAPRGEPAAGNPGVLMVDLETFLRADPPLRPGMVRIGGGGNHRPGAGAGDAVLRRNPFIQWKETWPRATSGGLSMRQVTPATTEKMGKAVGAAVTEYAFVHSPAYVQLEDTFFTLVMMHNHHPLIQFLKQHPFHISSLITVSRVAKDQDQNAALAADLCERALFSFGRSTLSSFRQALSEGRARLSFRRPENRQFLLAGFYYIRSLIPRGTYRTALAWCRLFLSVFPETDDYALLLYAHALAVRAFEAQWLIDLFGTDGDNDDDNDGDVSAAAALPALTRNPMRAYMRQTLVPARLQRKDRDGARAVLTRGISRLPWLYGALFQALGLDVPRAVWGAQPRDEPEALYTQLYLHVAKDLWDTAEATALLRVVTAELGLSTAARKDASALPAAEPVTENLARFVYLDGTPALMALAPQALLHAVPNYDFDPLPPPREENEFSNLSQQRPWLMAQESHVPMPQMDLDALFAMHANELGLDMNARADPFDMDDMDDMDGFNDGGNDANEDSDGLGGTDDPGQGVTERQPERREGGGSSRMPGAWVEDADSD